MAEPTTPIEHAVARLTAQARAAAAYAAYYEGRHPTRFVSDRYRDDFRELLADARCNLCRGVVDAHADRLAVVGFQSADLSADPNAAAADEAADHAWAVWRRNRMDRRQGEAYQGAFKAGDSFLVVWPDPAAPAANTARLDPNDATTTTVFYDDEDAGAVEWAAKAWRRSDGVWRLTLYYPDRIEKYAGKSPRQGSAPMAERDADYEPYQAEGERWPLANPYGRVPVFHVANNAPVGGFGCSELADVVPIQNRLNKTIMDLMVTSEFQNFRQRWATGVAGVLDAETGEEESPFKPGADQVWAVPAPDARFGEFGTADLTQLVALKVEQQLDIARVTKIPVRYLLQSVGESGAAKEMDDAPFAAKLRDRQTAFGNVLEDAMSFALEIEGRPGATLDCRWAPVLPRPERESWEIAALQLRAGVSPEQILRERDYPADLIRAVRAEAEAAAADEVLRQIGSLG